jgi:hypothetical protein
MAPEAATDENPICAPLLHLEVTTRFLLPMPDVSMTPDGSVSEKIMVIALSAGTFVSLVAGETDLTGISRITKYQSLSPSDDDVSKSETGMPLLLIATG